MEAAALNSLLCYHTENDVSAKVRGRRCDENENFAQNNEALRDNGKYGG